MQLFDNLFNRRTMGYGATDNPPSPPPGGEANRPIKRVVTNPFTGRSVVVFTGRNDEVTFTKQIAAFSSGGIDQVRDEVNSFCQGLAGVQNPQITVKKDGDGYIGVAEYVNITAKPGG